MNWRITYLDIGKPYEPYFCKTIDIKDMLINIGCNLNPFFHGYGDAASYRRYLLVDIKYKIYLFMNQWIKLNNSLPDNVGPTSDAMCKVFINALREDRHAIPDKWSIKTN